MNRSLLAVLAILGGLAQATSVAAFWNGQPQWWLQMLSLLLLVGVLDRSRSPWAAGVLGWAFAIAWLCGTFWWLFISMHVYGGMPSPLAALGVLLLAAFLGSYYGVAGWVYRRWRREGRPLANAVLFSSAWLAAELMRASWFTGFPWGAGGYAHVDGPLSVFAPWIGVYGIGVCASLVSALLASFARRGGPSPAPALAAVAALVLVAGAARWMPPAQAQSPTGGRALSVTLLQGNIPQDEKFESGTGVPLALNWYREQLARVRTSLVVAPETSIPMLPHQLPPGYFEAIRARFASGEQAAMIGLPLGSYEAGYTNSVVGLRPGAQPYRYDKFHLVPFGEFIPPLFKWFTRMMNIPLGDFDRGSVRQPSFEWQGLRLAPNICYEDLFGEDLAPRFRDAATAPHVFVNVSNIAWFGNSIAIDQHLHISRMRAIEFARPMIRATNTGATVVIDAAGRVTHALERHTRDALIGEVNAGHGITPYAWWMSRLGLWPLWLLALAGVAWVARRRAVAP